MTQHPSFIYVRSVPTSPALLTPWLRVQLQTREDTLLHKTMSILHRLFLLVETKKGNRVRQCVQFFCSADIGRLVERKKGLAFTTSIFFFFVCTLNLLFGLSFLAHE